MKMQNNFIGTFNGVPVACSSAFESNGFCGFYSSEIALNSYKSLGLKVVPTLITFSK
jgi:hypothetical protein